MKTNISSLMIMLSNKESDLSAAKSDILDYAVNTSIQELDGTVNVTEDYKVDFDEAYSKIDELIKENNLEPSNYIVDLLFESLIKKIWYNNI